MKPISKINVFQSSLYNMPACFNEVTAGLLTEVLYNYCIRF